MITGGTRHAFELGLLGVLALLWGSSYLLTKIILTDIPPVTLIAGRCTIAALFLLLVMTVTGERLPRDLRTWRALFIQAVFNSIGAWTILAWGQQFVGSGLVAVLNSTSPIFVFLGTVLLTRHEAAGPKRLIGAGLGIIGVGVIVGVDAPRDAPDHLAGELAALVGAVLYAAAAIYGKRFAHIPPTATAAGTMIWAVICLVPASLYLDRPWTLAPSGISLAALMGLGVFCTGLALLIYFRLVRTLGSMGVASQSYLRAGVGVLLGAFLLGETISLTVGLGVVLAILGVALINAPPSVERVEGNAGD